MAELFCGGKEVLPVQQLDVPEAWVAVPPVGLQQLAVGPGALVVVPVMVVEAWSAPAIWLPEPPIEKTVLRFAKVTR